MNQFSAPDESHVFGGGRAETSLNPVYIIALLIAILLIFSVRRKRMSGPFLWAIFLIPIGQQVYLAGVHWLVGRILVLATLARMVTLRSSRGSLFSGGFNNIDRAFFFCSIAQAVAFTLLYRDGAALVNQAGNMIDLLGAYCVVRFLIEDDQDIYSALKTMAAIGVVLAIGMVIEQRSMQNIFGMLGGTQAVPSVREGRIRSQGAFQHALTAGTFGATLPPLFVMLWRNGKSKLWSVIGLAGSIVVTICSNSSTPLLAWVSGFFAICLWPLRKNMQTLRRVLVIVLIILNMIMKAPVWFLMARIDLTGGSSGYHRAELVDQFIRHFSDWWLIGTANAGTWGWDLWDTQDQYVSVGETGGLVALVMFIVYIYRCYARIGTSRRLFAGSAREWQLWFLGAALFSNLVSFFGVNYYDQSKVAWFVLIAMIVAATNVSLHADVDPPKSVKPEWFAAPPQVDAIRATVSTCAVNS